MRKQYNENEDFKEYVDKYCKKHKCTVDQAFAHALIKEVSEHYKNKEKPT